MQLTRKQLDSLIGAVAKGDEAAFAELYQVSSSKLFAVALRILRNREAAEEVLQESYFRVWEKAGDFNPALALTSGKAIRARQSESDTGTFLYADNLSEAVAYTGCGHHAAGCIVKTDLGSHLRYERGKQVDSKTIGCRNECGEQNDDFNGPGPAETLSGCLLHDKCSMKPPFTI